MSVVVSDTSPLGALPFLGLLDLLPRLYTRVWIPPKVAQEAGRAAVRVPALDASAYPWMLVRAPGTTSGQERVLERLDAGETEALYLALELRADAVLMDDLAGRAAARRLGLRPACGSSTAGPAARRSSAPRASSP